MHGFLDPLTNESFLTLDFGQGFFDFLIDTGFDGSLVVGEGLLDRSRSLPAGFITAELASGQTYRYETFFVEFDWLGQRIQTRLLLGTGTECLLGTTLLAPHRLEIDYGKQTVDLIRQD